MSLKYVCSLAILGVIAVAATPAMAESDISDHANFTCDSENGIPVTISKANSRTIFRWGEQFGENATEICKDVANKLDKYVAEKYIGENASSSQLFSLAAYEQKQLSSPMICITETENNINRCQVVLLTLPNAENSGQVANQLLDEILVDQDLRNNKETSAVRGIQSNRYSISIFDLLFGPKYLK